MTPKLRQQLDTIDQWLTEEGGKDLAHILAALRGPDVETFDADLTKRQTTAVIRSAAFPKLAAITHQTRFASAWVFSYPGEYYRSPDTLGFHFKTHVDLAAETLGLSEPRYDDELPPRSLYFPSPTPNDKVRKP
jgi:hypothetical protein